MVMFINLQSVQKVISQDLFCLFCNTCAGQPQMWMYLMLGFRPVHNYASILETVLDRTKFIKCVAVSKAYPKKDIGRVA
jgi:hypothetical protein